jgi:hypothetical protein
MWATPDSTDTQVQYWKDANNKMIANGTYGNIGFLCEEKFLHPQDHYYFPIYKSPALHSKTTNRIWFISS